LYPLSRIFNDVDNHIIESLSDIISNYLLPFYLYLFLSVLAFDIFLLINRFFRFVPSVRLSSTKFKKTGLISIMLISLFVMAAGIINFNTIRTSEYMIEVPAGSAKISNLRVAFAADFHLKENTNIRFVERFAREVAIADPDILLLGGDIADGNTEDQNMLIYETILKSIRPEHGVFTVLGNHEYYSGNDNGNFFERSGIKVLSDTIIVVDNSFSLGGRYDSHVRNRKSLQKLLESDTDSLPLILLDHRPTEIDEVSRTGVDIQLSGHTHNGQMFPINLIMRNLYQLVWGYRKIGNTHFFVTSGIRLWGPPVRTAGKSEIMIIDIVFKGISDF
jgi:predicted MPP superfamily phosphohydrolase